MAIATAQLASKQGKIRVSWPQILFVCPRSRAGSVAETERNPGKKEGLILVGLVVVLVVVVVVVVVFAAEGGKD